jgi:DNA-binding CsgD family transcriptional regulator
MLSPQEIHVFNCLFNGLNIREIAVRLQISEQDVLLAIAALRKNMNVSNELELLLEIQHRESVSAIETENAALETRLRREMRVRSIKQLRRTCETDHYASKPHTKRG